MAEPYRPTSAEEGEAFFRNHCARCAVRRAGQGCDIDERGTMNEIGHPDFPTEWVIDRGHGTCTAFEGVADG